MLCVVIIVARSARLWLRLRPQIWIWIYQMIEILIFWIKFIQKLKLSEIFIQESNRKVFSVLRMYFRRSANAIIMHLNGMQPLKERDIMVGA